MTEPLILPVQSLNADQRSAIAHIETVILDDLRDLVKADRVTRDKKLMDRVCVEMARSRAASLGIFLAEAMRAIGYDQVERDAADAAARGEIQ